MAKDGTTHGSRAGSVAKSIWAKIFPRPRICWLPTGCLVRKTELSSLNFYNFL